MAQYITDSAFSAVRIRVKRKFPIVSSLQDHLYKFQKLCLSDIAQRRFWTINHGLSGRTNAEELYEYLRRNCLDTEHNILGLDYNSIISQDMFLTCWPWNHPSRLISLGCESAVHPFLSVSKRHDRFPGKPEFPTEFRTAILISHPFQVSTEPLILWRLM